MSSVNKIKERLYKELELKAAFNQDGFSVSRDVLRHIGTAEGAQEQVQCLFNYNRIADASLNLPSFITLPNGLVVAFRHDSKSLNKLEFDGKDFYAVRHNGDAYKVQLTPRPKYYSKLTSDGTPMRTVAIHNTDGVVFVAYSNECSCKPPARTASSATLMRPRLPTVKSRA